MNNKFIDTLKRCNCEPLGARETDVVRLYHLFQTPSIHVFFKLQLRQLKRDAYLLRVEAALSVRSGLTRNKLPHFVAQGQKLICHVLHLNTPS